MTGYCGIDIDTDMTYICLAGSKKLRPVFLQEEQLKVTYGTDSLIDFLKNNSEALKAKISEGEKKSAINADTVYLNLPWGLPEKFMAEATVPLSSRKKIDWKDIHSVKKYLQDAYLDWDDVCVHHLVINYEVEGITYKNPPVGLVAKKIKIKSVLFAVKDKFRKDVEDIFNNLEKRFAGFVFPGLSMLCAGFNELNKESRLAAINVAYDKTYVAIYQEGFIDFIVKFDFSLKKILDELGQKLILAPALADEVFRRYVSFKDMPRFKEVSIKNTDTYVSLSTQTVNSFVKESVRNGYNLLLNELKKNIHPETVICLLGRLNSREGLEDFLKGCSSYKICVARPYECASSSFGCVRYGTDRMLESEGRSNSSFLRRMGDVYKDYF